MYRRAGQIPDPTCGPELRHPGVRMAAMPMRTQCRHYESRTYPSGEIVQKCRLDVAPEAPWRCPEDCSFFELRRFDAGWNHGSLGKPARRPEPEPVGAVSYTHLRAHETDSYLVCR